MNRFVKKRRTRRSRLWLAVFGVISMGLVSFGVCDDNDGGFDCDDSDYDTTCDADDDGDCDCDHHTQQHDDPWEELREAALRAECEQEAYSIDIQDKPAKYQTKPKQIKQARKNPDNLKRELRKKRLVAFLFKRKKIQVGFSSSNLLEQNATKALQLLKEQAFTKIKLIPVLDIGPKSRISVGKVEEVSIGDQNIFTKTDMFPYDAPISICYHDKIEVTIPYSAKSLRKQNYQEVYNKLTELGFTRIHKYPRKDIVLGWLNKEGEVEEVSIAGNSRFKENTTYKFDVAITISYHTSIATKNY